MEVEQFAPPLYVLEGILFQYLSERLSIIIANPMVIVL